MMKFLYFILYISFIQLEYVHIYVYMYTHVYIKNTTELTSPRETRVPLQSRDWIPGNTASRRAVAAPAPSPPALRGSGAVSLTSVRAGPTYPALHSAFSGQSLRSKLLQ